jgi:uncharacterized protein (DUF58 family)
MNLRSLFTGKGRPSRPPSKDPGAAPFHLSPQALLQLNRLRLNTGLLLPGLATGARPSRQRRPGAEFRDFRQYAPGDDIRYVDWKASARQEHIFIKQGEQQKDSLVYLLIDCSASMGWGTPSKSQAALSLAYALGYLALAQGDRLVVWPISGARKAHPLGPVRGKGQVPLLANTLQALRFEGEVDLARFIAGLGRRALLQEERSPAPLRNLQERASTGLVVVISDLLGASEFPRTLEAFSLPAWNVVICHLLHPAEIDPDLNGSLEIQDIETGQKKNYTVTPRLLESYRSRLQAWQAELARACLERKAVYTMIPTDWSLEKETLPHLLKARVVTPSRAGSL